jgi:hypothetical protein
MGHNEHVMEKAPPRTDCKFCLWRYSQKKAGEGICEECGEWYECYACNNFHGCDTCEEQANRDWFDELMSRND